MEEVMKKIIEIYKNDVLREDVIVDIIYEFTKSKNYKITEDGSLLCEYTIVLILSRDFIKNFNNNGTFFTNLLNRFLKPKVAVNVQFRVRIPEIEIKISTQYKNKICEDTKRINVFDLDKIYIKKLLETSAYLSDEEVKKVGINALSLLT